MRATAANLELQPGHRSSGPRVNAPGSRSAGEVTALDPDESTGENTRRRRVSRWWIVGPLVILVLVAAGVAVLVWSNIASSYNPLSITGGQGPATEKDTASFGRPTDSIRQTTVTVKPGQTAHWVVQLFDEGSHDVVVDSIDNPWPNVTVDWSPYHFVPGGSAWGEPLQWQPFPASIPAQDLIDIRLTITSPACPAGGSAFDAGITALTVHWHALGKHHTTDVNVGNDPNIDPTQSVALIMCPATP